MATRDPMGIPPGHDPDRFGLCSSCANVRWVKSGKGSVFVLCELAERDPAYSRYPRIPVTRCAGYHATDIDASD